jgi:hypothetical protein
MSDPDAETVALVDSCVLIDCIVGGAWAAWAEATIASWPGILAIDPVIYAEVATGFDSLEICDAALPPAMFRRLHPPWEAAFLAGQAQRHYRKDGGRRERTLPDFQIGAHAAVSGLTLITRDPRRYRRHFPRLALIAPDTHFQALASKS